jgi:hypothetical protein
VVQIARKGSPAPDGNGTFSFFHDLRSAINDNGEVTFHAELTGAPSSEDSGIFRGNGGPLVQIARAGQTSPDGNGTFTGFSVDPVMNNFGQAAFVAGLAGTMAGSNDNSAIYRGGGTSLTQIVRKGQTAPDGNGVFSSLGEPAINNAGQIVFTATLSGTNGGANDNNGIYIYDDALGLQQVARTGQIRNDSLVITLGVETLSNTDALGELGQVAYRFQLANDYQGVALWKMRRPGDHNDDQFVDAADYVAWRKLEPASGYVEWVANFGESSTPSATVEIVASSAAVPEPSTLLLIVLSCLTIPISRVGWVRRAAGTHRSHAHVMGCPVAVNPS